MGILIELAKQTDLDSVEKSGNRDSRDWERVEEMKSTGNLILKFYYIFRTWKKKLYAHFFGWFQLDDSDIEWWLDPRRKFEIENRVKDTVKSGDIDQNVSRRRFLGICDMCFGCWR